MRWTTFFFGLAATLLATSTASAWEPDPPQREKDRFVHQVGYIMPTTISREHVTIGFYGITYTPAFRKPYDPDRAWILGNEIGVQLRVVSSIRTHAGIATQFGLAPTSFVRRKGSRFAFPSLFGALMPELGYVLVSGDDQKGRPTVHEMYIRHLARFQYFFGDDSIVGLDLAPFVQLTVPFDYGEKRIDGGFLLGVSVQMPPKDD